MTVEEEDIPIHNRPRVQAWAASNRGSFPRPLLGSSERQAMLEDAQLIEKDAGLLFDKIKVLRIEAELLMEKAYHKRVICAPIRSLPLEILNRILLLATPDNFAFGVSQCVAHPLSTVSKAWYDIINSTPEFYSQINIDTSEIDRNTSGVDLPEGHSPLYRQKSQLAARRLPSWLAKARNTGLKITFDCEEAHEPDDYSSGPLHEMWVMLLSLVANWQEFSYYGTFPFIQQFLEKAESAQSLRSVSLWAFDPSNFDNLMDTSSPFPCKPSFPRLQHLQLSGSFLANLGRLPYTRSLQVLTFQGPAVGLLTKERLPGYAASFPFLPKLRLDDIDGNHFQYAPGLLSEFKHLQHFELSQGSHYVGKVALSALNGCRALKTLRLRRSACDIDDKCEQLPSVDRLELEINAVAGELKGLFPLLPSLKFLKVSPPADASGKTCDARGLLDELFVQEDLLGRQTCPDLAELCLERAKISKSDIACFIADRTFNAAPAAVKFLEDECYYYRAGATARTDVPGPHRNGRYATWKPTCLVTTSECPDIPDMASAGLDAVIDECRRGRLNLNQN